MSESSAHSSASNASPGIPSEGSLSWRNFFSSGPVPWINVFTVFSLIVIPMYWANVDSSATLVIALLSITALIGRVDFLDGQCSYFLGGDVHSALTLVSKHVGEIVFCLTAVRRGNTDLAEYIMIGTIVLNLTLQLGVVFVARGLHETVSKISLYSYNEMLLLLGFGVFCFVLPTVETSNSEVSNASAGNNYNRLISLAAFLIYLLYCGFQVNARKSAKKTDDTVSRTQDSTHVANALRSPFSQPPADSPSLREVRDTFGSPYYVDAHQDPVVDCRPLAHQELTTAATLTFFAIVIVLLVISEVAIVDSIIDLKGSGPLSTAFLAGVLVPVCAAAVRLISATNPAYWSHSMCLVRGSLDRGLFLLLCLYPCLQILSWWMRSDAEMSFAIGGFQGGSLVLSSLAFLFAVTGGSTNWLLGVGMSCVYFGIAAGYFGHSNEL